jgi:hypothetical protein
LLFGCVAQQARMSCWASTTCVCAQCVSQSTQDV